MGYFVERQATNESLHGLSFWQTGEKLVTEADFEREHHGFC
jgi:hypothetical protein